MPDKNTEDSEFRRHSAFQMAASFPPPHGYATVEDILAAAKKIEDYLAGKTKEPTQ